MPAVATDAVDEMVDGNNRFRPGWRGLLGAIADLGHERLADRAALLDRVLAEAVDEEPGAPRCDPIPLILPAREFAALVAGLAQRATLIEAVLRDVYGPQRLLEHGLLPPALVHANPAFLRPCRDATGAARAAPLLQLYAADLLRGPDGLWRVVADRTAVPAGLAAAALHRAELARTLPELFRGTDLLQPRPFFELWQDALQRLAQGMASAGPGENPSVALLGSGPGSPRWSETLILARALSCAVVEGGDLTIRGGQVFLKTLQGLARVDVLLRRQDGRGIDPLELDPDPHSGVAGLLEATRTGAVRIVNDPGAGFAEAPALAAYLPALAPALLGEPLRLPCAATLWLGDTAMRARAGALDGWVVRQALDGTVPSLRPAAMAPPARAALAARIGADPGGFALASALPASQAPCLARAPVGLQPRPVVLRLFLLWDGEAWQAFGGGLARSLPGPAGEPGLSKDVWVPAEEAGDLRGPASLAAAALPIRRAAGNLPSRAADDFYWLGRRLERSEAMARLLGAAAARLARTAPSPREAAELSLLTTALVWAELLEEELAGSGFGAGSGAGPLASGALHAGGPKGPLARELAEVARLAGGLRDRLSGEMRAALGAELRGVIELLGNAGAGPAALGRATARVQGFAATVAGLTAENMVRGGGRLFLDLGRRIERAGTTAGLVGVLLAGSGPVAARGGLQGSAPGSGADAGRLDPALRLTLEIGDAALTYRARYLTLLQPAPALDLVLADIANPRSLAFQLAALRDMLLELEAGLEAGAGSLANAATTLLEDAGAMVREVAEAHVQAVAAAALPARLSALADAVAALSDLVARRWFALLPAPRGVGLPMLPASPGARRRGIA